MSSIIQNLLKNRFARFGVPFIGLLVVGSFGLKEFAQLRYTFRKNRLITEEEAKKHGLRMKPSELKPTIEKELALIKEHQEELDTWQNIRGPRPWENSKEIQDMQRKQQ